MTTRKFKTKVCLVGESGVGKTSLIKKYVLDIFDDKYISTIGTKVSKKSQTLKTSAGDADMDMMIWDIMGQASFRVLLQDAYFYGAHGIIAVCDSTRTETLENIHAWVDSVRDVIGEVPIVFLANKSDLGDEVVVNLDSMEKELKNYNMPFLTSSAKTGLNVDVAFEKLGYMILDKMVD